MNGNSWLHRNVRKTLSFFKKKTKPSSLESTSTANASSVNTTKQTARDEPDVEFFHYPTLSHQASKIETQCGASFGTLQTNKYTKLNSLKLKLEKLCGWYLNVKFV